MKPCDQVPSANGSRLHTRHGLATNMDQETTKSTRPPTVVSLPQQKDPSSPHRGTTRAFTSCDKRGEDCWDSKLCLLQEATAGKYKQPTKCTEVKHQVRQNKVTEEHVQMKEQDKTPEKEVEIGNRPGKNSG